MIRSFRGRVKTEQEKKHKGREEGEAYRSQHFMTSKTTGLGKKYRKGNRETRQFRKPWEGNGAGLPAMIDKSASLTGRGAEKNPRGTSRGGGRGREMRTIGDHNLCL